MRIIDTLWLRNPAKNHDKVYVGVDFNGKHYCFWGRRGGKLRSIQYSSSEASDKLNEKLREGYESVLNSENSSDRDVAVKCEREVLSFFNAPDNVNDAPAPRIIPQPVVPSVKKILPKKKVLVPDFAICLDARGVECLQTGAEYLFVRDEGEYIVVGIGDEEIKAWKERFKLIYANTQAAKERKVST